MKHKGKGLIFTGLLLIAAALFLTGYNLFDQMPSGRRLRPRHNWRNGCPKQLRRTSRTIC